MGSSKQTTNETTHQSSGPWLPAQPVLKDMLGKASGFMDSTAVTQKETDAIDALGNNAGNATRYLPQVQGLASDLLAGGGMGAGRSGIEHGYSTARDALTPIARGDFVDPMTNPHLRKILDQTQRDVRNHVGSAFAGAGRSFSGAHMNSLGNALGDATNRTYLDSYNSERDRQLGAVRDLVSTGIGTSGALDATMGNMLGARTAGVGMGQTAVGMEDDPYLRTLEAEAMRRGLPMQNLGMLRDLILPIAGLGQESDGQATRTTETKQNPFQMALGAAMGGLGMLGGMGGMGGMGGGLGMLGSMFGSRAARSPFSQTGSLY